MEERQEMRVRSLGREDPWRRKWHPTPVFLPGESHGQRSLVGYSPWGCKELDTTEHACTMISKFGFLEFRILFPRTSCMVAIFSEIQFDHPCSIPGIRFVELCLTNRPHIPVLHPEMYLRSPSLEFWEMLKTISWFYFHRWLIICVFICLTFRGQSYFPVFCWGRATHCFPMYCQQTGFSWGKTSVQSLVSGQMGTNGAVLSPGTQSLISVSLAHRGRRGQTHGWYFPMLEFFFQFFFFLPFFLRFL